MKTEMEAARDAAWKKSIFATNKFSSDLRRNNVVRGIFNEGFDAGWNARGSQWVAVSERLPVIDHTVIAAGEGTNGLRDYWAVKWGDHSDHINEAWLKRWKVVAWMPIPPYDSGQRTGG